MAKNIFNSNISELEICNNAGKCINYNLFRLGTFLDHNIPNFIYYKIILNKKLLYSNIKLPNSTTLVYQMEKDYYLNEFTKITVNIGIDKVVGDKLEAEIKKPVFYITDAFSN